MSSRTARTLTVGDLAAISGVTVRTLHHYEEIGLLVPAGRSGAGYRQYSEADCDRLSRILYYRELGFPLDTIATLLDDVERDRYEHLERQHTLLRERLVRIQAMVASIEREMEAHMTGYNLTAEERLEVFGDFNPAEYEDEARERWGDTDAWKQSQDRAKRYSKDDWQRIQAEMADLNDRFVTAMNAGSPPTGDVAMALAGVHRQLIVRWFYECSYEFHRGLGEMYVDDPRFTANIDKTAPGLAAYLRDAIVANVDRHA
ncbi:MAG: MerR family transcriptional regulator [Chloroflexia bacterium]|nr:MerR family transcriptional regulator [Chloroflexia bacterium]